MLPQRMSTPALGHPKLAPWRCVGRSRIGESHIESGMPCQDRFATLQLPHGCRVFAVSDGAGSAARSHLGAEVAVKLATRMAQRLWATNPPTRSREFLDAADRILVAADQGVHRFSKARGIPLGELWATLLVVVATPDSVVMGQVGDGAGVIRDTAGRVEILATPYQGRFANEAVFLGCPGALEASSVVSLRREVESLALFSDGLDPVAMASAVDPHVPFFGRLFDEAAATPSLGVYSSRLGKFLASPELAERTNDDRTLLVAWRDATNR